MGGIQVIFTGDFFQLPPVPDVLTQLTTNMNLLNNDNKENQLNFTKFKQSIDIKRRYCFQSCIWNQLFHSKNTFLLTKVFRQNDSQFASLLENIRWGQIKGNLLNISYFISFYPIIIIINIDSDLNILNQCVGKNLHCENYNNNINNINEYNEILPTKIFTHRFLLYHFNSSLF